MGKKRTLKPKTVLCKTCGYETLKFMASPRTLCRVCKKDKDRKRALEYHFKLKAEGKVKQMPLEYRLAYQKRRWRDSSDWRQRNLKRMVDRRLSLRRLVMTHYGGFLPSCKCCGETEYNFLCIDHMNNDGAKHRKEIGRISILSWLVRNNFPDGFQILCYNCNCAKGFYGYCPHRSPPVHDFVRRKRDSGD
jgi:hypothetical protein